MEEYIVYYNTKRIDTCRVQMPSLSKTNYLIFIVSNFEGTLLVRQRFFFSRWARQAVIVGYKAKQSR